jgi:hypothetical protein
MNLRTTYLGLDLAFDRWAPTPPPPDCVHIPVDIASDQSTEEGLRVLREHHGSHIVAVTHLAAYYDFLGKPSPKYDEITVEGTERLLRGLLRENFEVEQFIFTSTMLVHQPGEPGQFITEDWPLAPTWAYPESKVRTEALIRAERGDIRAVILRLAGVYDDVCHSPPLAHQIQRIFERQLAVSREPGRCPKCGMTLVPRSGTKEHAGHGHADMMVEDHQKLLWPHYLAMMLGFWLLTSPITLCYMSDFAPDANQLRVMTERGLPGATSSAACS